jgi:hypothetical protein
MTSSGTFRPTAPARNGVTAAQVRPAKVVVFFFWSKKLNSLNFRNVHLFRIKLLIGGNGEDDSGAAGLFSPASVVGCETKSVEMA